MWRIGVALAVILVVGAALFYFGQVVISIEVIAVGLFLLIRKMFLRGIYRYFVFPFILLWLPQRWRRALFNALEACNVWMLRAWDKMYARWQRADWPMRILISIGGVMLSVLMAILLLISPLRFGGIPLVGMWLKERILPFLWSTAAAKGIEIQIPPAWKKLPAKLREPVARHYSALWYRVANWAVRAKDSRAELVASRRQQELLRRLQLELEHEERKWNSKSEA